MVSLISKKYQKDIAFLMLMVLSLNFTAPLYGSGVTGMFDFPERAEEKSHLSAGLYFGSESIYNDREEAALEPAQDYISSEDEGVGEEAIEDEKVEDFDTDGPSQPEMRGFTPVGASDMVDLFTGDFSYNIPLLDVGGYPVNISYSGNVSMEQEASWVGLGWNINPGSISRSSRGIPDDFNGEDKIVATNRMKPHTVIGGTTGGGLEVIGKTAPLRGSKLSGEIGGYYNSRSGWGAQIGVNATYNISKVVPNSPTENPSTSESESEPKPAPATNDSSSLGKGLSVGFKFDSQEGAGVNLTASHVRENLKTGVSGLGSISTNYNSRQGFKDLNLGFASNKLYTKGRDNRAIGSDFFMNSPVPAVNSPLSSTNVNFELKPGYEFTLLQVNTKFAGYYVRSGIKEKDETILKSAYGYLHYERSRLDENALLDFNRHKEGIYRVRPLAQNIGIPVYTYDIFSVSGEGSSGTFRAYRSDIGSMRDPSLKSKNNSIGSGIDLGFGGGPLSVKVGGNITVVHSETESGGWNMLNYAISKVPFTNKWGYHEPAYFKNMGEMSISKQKLYEKFGDEQLVKFAMNDVNLLGKIGLNPVFSLQSKLDVYNDNITKTGTLNINSRVEGLGVREARNQLFTYYTADESIDMREAEIQSYYPNYFSTYKLPFLPGNFGVLRIPRKDPNIRKGHHISMVSVLNEDGRRYEYNIPVYNLDNREVTYSVRRHRILDEEKNETFSIAKKEVIGSTKLSGYRINDADSDLATDKYYSRQITPAYSHSFLLTGIFSPDYVDVTGDGPSEDDLGDGISFKYSQVYGSWDPYKWRIPFNKVKDTTRYFEKVVNGLIVKDTIVSDYINGNYEEGLRTDFRDDKASYVYGEKEVWYLNRIESKTMLATFIISKNRLDAASQVSEVGGRDEAKQLYRLDEIRLYAKSDFARSGLNAKPIKTVHFEYDHSLCAGYPLNRYADSGKLTLTKIWFSYNGNKKGRVNAYKFHYRNNQRFAYQASDNWGNYKDKLDNPVGPDGKVLSNRDYPYPVSNGALAGKNGNIAPWALDSIVLPSGSNIKVSYESDDYGYVQNRRAMQLFRIYGFGKTNNVSLAGNRLYDYNDNSPEPQDVKNGDTYRYVFVKLPKPFKSKGEVESLYLKDIKQLYFKLNVKMPLDPAFDIYNKRYEYVKLYSEIKDFGIADISNNIIWIELRSSSRKNDNEDGYSPLTKAVLQFIRTTLPMKGYPGSAFPADGSLNVASFTKALINSFGTIKEFVQSFHTKQLNSGHCRDVDLSSSFIRLTDPYQKKVGGGYRVKRVVIHDNWDKMTGQKQSSYGQEYLYTKEADNGYGKDTISSGVATFEPFLGGEENPFRYPLEMYNQRSGLLGPQDLFYTEGPMLEAFYPGASVGYSVVRVKSIHSEGVKSKTGLSESRFYTAYDYPVKEYYTPLGDGFTNFRTPPGTALKNPLKYVSFARMAFSQGFKIELNDMHGKVRSQSSYSATNLKEPLSQTIYHYKSKEVSSESRRLVNDVSVVDKSGSVTTASMGRDIEVMTDFREHQSRTFSGGVNFNFHFVLIGVAPTQTPRVMPSGGNFALNATQAASLVKVINKRAVVEKVEVLDKGSRVATENVAYDAETGQVLVTKTKNEFGDSLYTVNIPAHWRYDRMGPAYKNVGVEVTDGITNGRLQNSFNEQYFVPGDEVLCTVYGPITPLLSSLPIAKSTVRLWVARSSDAVSDVSYKDPVKEMPGFGSSYSGINFVTRGGQLFHSEGRAVKLKIIKSGRKNQPGASVGSITLKGNPIVGNQLKIDWNNNVLNASSMEFKEDWANKARFWQLDSCRIPCECPPGYTLDIATRNCIIAGDSLPTVRPDSVPLFGHFPDPIYGIDGMKIYQPGKFKLNGTDLNTPANSHTLDVTAVTSSYWKNTGSSTGIFNRGAVWLKNANGTPFSRENPNGSTYSYPLDTAIGFIKTIEVPVSKYYYFGLGADNISVIKVDCQTVFDNSDLFSNEWYENFYRSWNVYPIYLTAGAHTIEMLGKNVRLENVYPNPGAFSIEIYNNTESEIISATSDNDLNILFSSREMINKPLQVGKTYGIDCPSGCLRESNGRIYCAENVAVSASCVDKDPVGEGTENANPYVQGLLGNYRAWRSYAYYDARKEPGVNDTTNIRTYGLINNFTPFWTYNTSSNWLADNKGSKWVWTSESTLYDRKGNGVESRDPLGRYTSGQFGYNQTVPIAVSQNSKYRESGFDGFEDYDYKLDSYIGLDSCAKIILKHFDWTKYKHLRSAEFSHTGLYSLKVPQSEQAFVKFKVSDTSEDNRSVWIRDNRGSNSYPKGLITNEDSWLPVYSPTYKDSIVVSAWVREQDLCKTGGYEQAGIVVSFENASFATVGTPVPLKASGPVIEGWQRIEGVVMVPAGSTGVNSMRVSLEGGSSQAVYYDDLRIHPFKANMKSFVYHPVNLRLLSELDENNYASFYEYDDEGTLIRVKKETERGVKTIKETRSALIKQED